MVSLIVSTLNRVVELDHLLTSLDLQRHKQFEVVLVDQNEDDRISPILQRHPKLSIRHLRSSRGLSHGRNVGLSQATGDIIAIPDDDCWYPNGLLAAVTHWFATHLKFHALSTIKLDGDHSPVGPNWPKSAREVDRFTLWQCAISSTVFMRRELVQKVGQFNENIGIGASSRFQSGEETDYLLRALENGFRIWYEPSIVVHHPPLASPERLIRNTYPFALGAGYVMGSHRFPWWYLGDRLLRSLGGTAVNLICGRFQLAEIYRQRLLGQLRGYVAGRKS